MKLSQWAKSQGITYATAYKWFKAGLIPVETSQLSTGTILVHTENIGLHHSKTAILYARVSSHDQKEDLKRQLIRLRDFASAAGYQISEEVSEIGSGLNAKRPKLNRILKDSSSDIIVEHRDRLTRFGFDLIESSLKGRNRNIIVINANELNDDIVRDFIEIITSMCSRIYGRRSGKNKAAEAIKTVGLKDNNVTC